MLLNEGFPSVPEKVLRPIKDYYIEIWKRNYTLNIQRITEKNTPHRTFRIDFTGTTFEHLNKMHPTIEVILTSGSEAWCDPEIKKGKGKIKLGLKRPAASLYHTVEHEVFHYIQFLIQDYNLRYKNQKSEIGGLPSKTVMPDYKDVHGRGRSRRIAHSLRPIEYYPDLLTTVRELHYKFYEKHHKDPNWKEIENSTKAKTDFFMEFLNAVRNGESFGIYAGHVFKRFKTISEKFYFYMLKKAYEGFVNLPRNFDADEIKQLISTRTKDLIQKNLEKVNNASTKNIGFSYFHPLRFESYDRCDIMGELGDQDLEVSDGLSDSGEYVFAYLGIFEKENKNGSEYRLPIRPKNIENLFKTLKRLKNENKNIFSLSVNDNKTGKVRDLNPDEIPLVYDSIFKEIKKRYLDAADVYSGDNLEKLIDGAYR